MEHEALILDNLALATAAKNSDGFVIAQVQSVCAAPGALNPRQVVVPGVMVDCVVIARPTTITRPTAPRTARPSPANSAWRST